VVQNLHHEYQINKQKALHVLITSTCKVSVIVLSDQIPLILMLGSWSSFPLHQGREMSRLEVSYGGSWMWIELGSRPPVQECAGSKREAIILPANKVK
jgi:hypothetical protein